MNIIKLDKFLKERNQKATQIIMTIMQKFKRKNKRIKREKQYLLQTYQISQKLSLSDKELL